MLPGLMLTTFSTYLLAPAYKYKFFKFTFDKHMIFRFPLQLLETLL